MEKKADFWKRISRAEVVLIFIASIIGCANIILTPLGAGYDEDQHFYRAWQMARLQFVPIEMSRQRAEYPNFYYELSYRRQPLVESVGFDYWGKYGTTGIYDQGHYYGPLDTRSRYNPILLLPQALTLRYSVWKFTLPALATYYLTRLTGLATYILLAWLGIRSIPFGKWILLYLAVSPSAIYQASTISADTITNGVGILFIGMTLAIAQKEKIQIKDWLILILLIASIFTTKPNLYPLVLLPFLCIPPSRFWHKGAYPLLMIGSVLLFGVISLGWNMISPDPGLTSSGSINAGEQIKLIVSNPFWFPGVLINDLFIYGQKYMVEWIGTYGFGYGKVPSLTYILFLAGLFIALLAENTKTPDQRTRLGLLLVFAGCYLATEAALYIAYTTVGEKFVYGVQGRYFTPIAPLLFLALTGIFTSRKLHLHIAMFFSILASLLFVAGLVFSFHVVCGPTYFTRGLCYQPVYKNYSPLLRSTAPISDGVTLTQEIRPTCNGLTLIQVRINSAGPESDGRTRFLAQDEQQGVIVADKTIKNNSLPNDDWYILEFSPDWNSAGKLYTVTIQGKGGDLTSGPRIAYSLNPEYPYGVLYENGNAMEDDIIFQYGCITGLEKLFNKEN